MGTFSSIFAPTIDNDEGLKIVLDILGLGFALMAAPIWNIALKEAKIVSDNTLGAIKDTINPIVSNGVTLIKDTSDATQELNNQNALDTNMGNMVGLWESTMSTYASDLFNGTDTNSLFNVIKNGQMISYDKGDLTGETIIGYVAGAIFARLIPAAWQLSNANLGTLIIDSQTPCGTVNPLPKDIDPTVGSKNWVCVNNGLYYLLGATGQSRNCLVSRYGTECYNNVYSALPGVDQLNNPQFGGITLQDLVIGSVNSYNASGNKNGGKAADPSDASTLSDLYDNSVRTAGVIQIPVCTVDEARNNWNTWSSGGQKSANYPCS
ncbi:MAG: hypothetical protein M1822_001016 [Bathelium mastoideum]|nr:MAG: hypothetical protein M1822_001016 [Bathelium mastoideum]